jgi:threonyl-tRNA synthetase
MTTIRLPDGSSREFDDVPDGMTVAASIGKRLAKDAIAVRVDRVLKDLSAPIADGSQVEIVTRDSADGLELLRHDAAHVLAEAVKELYPETQVTIGPVIEDGFYYDFARETAFTPDDLELIEKRMRDIVERDETIVREVWQRDEASVFFTGQGEHYKAEIIADLPADEEISLYRQGDFIDLCRGPHLPSTGRLGKAFKLMSVAGAYWRGDSRNAMLQRIYGTAWANDKDLRKYLHRLAEAERRDHRKLGREMDLFHLQEEAAGSVFWHQHGWTLHRECEAYMRERLEQAGYIEVRTPQLVDRSLWEASGHWEKFRENMYVTETDDDTVFALKPMNCPCHVQLFRQGVKSYRDLPLRMAEFGSCHRHEPSGALHGLMRVRAFTQDDAHIFCTEQQIDGESKRFCELLTSIYHDFGFDDVIVKFADRPPTRAGSDDVWDRAEAALLHAVEAAGIPYVMNPGEGAFYGPKLEFVLRDAIGRDWQCGTLQVDFVLPERLDASYVGEDGNKHRPVMLHRAILGSFERFIAILIENYAGHLPLWLAPVQVVVATIVSDADDYAREVAAAAQALGLRTELDLRNEKINYKVREHMHRKIPALLVVGAKEIDERSVSVRRLGRKHQTAASLEEALEALRDEAVRRAGVDDANADQAA